MLRMLLLLLLLLMVIWGWTPLMAATNRWLRWWVTDRRLIQ